MRDRFGEEIKIGDRVVWAYNASEEALYEGTVSALDASYGGVPMACLMVEGYGAHWWRTGREIAKVLDPSASKT